MPRLYIDRKEKLEEAKALLKEAIRKFETGEIQHQFSLNNGHYHMYLPLFLHDLARISVIQNNEQEAVLYTSAAIQILTGSNAEGNFMPLLLNLRAGAYTKMGNFNLALEDYKKLYLSGSPSAADSMKRLFPLCNLKQQTFSAYLASVKSSQQNQPGDKVVLGNFSGTDLNGNKVSLSDLKGKIVVLNVWGIGCGPCIAEMPVLNKLVKAYANKPDVVFIAVTADQKEDLVKFFRTRTFDYKVLSNVQHIADIFNSNALPIHMLIGRNGEILNRSIGAREDIEAYLKSVIEANL